MSAEVEQDAEIVPEGFRPIRSGGEYIASNGPICFRREGGGLVFGFRVRERHCNPMGICHGGWLATMADMVMPIGARVAAGLDQSFLLTVSMSLDFLGPAPLGSWVEGQAELLNQTKRMVFAQGMLRVADRPVLRCSGVFRIGPPLPAPRV